MQPFRPPFETDSAGQFQFLDEVCIWSTYASLRESVSDLHLCQEQERRTCGSAA